VKAMNFGIGHTLNRFKYLIIGGTLAMGFMFTIETILFINYHLHKGRELEDCEVSSELF
jgi:hypothetical protein